MPSKRPSPSPLDGHLQSPLKTHAPNPNPKSKKRSSRPKPHMDNDPNPNPNPNTHSPPPSRKSERKRKPRSFPDSGGAVSGGGGGGGAGGGGTGAVQKLWTDADEVALLTGAAAFRARTGSVPRLPDMAALFESIKSSISPHLDQAKVYYKLKRLKSKFLHTAPAASGGGGPHDRRVRDLSADVWGSSEAPLRAVEQDINGDADADGNGDADDEEVEARYPVATEVLGEYWRANGHAMSGVSLEKGMALLSAEEGRAAEGKWRRQLEVEMRTRMRRHEISKEIYAMLIDAVKGLGP